MQSGTSKALAALIFTIVLWGIAPVFIRGVSVALGPADAFVIRLVASGLIFAVIAFFTTGFAISRKDVPHLLFVTFIGLFGYYGGTIFGFAYAPAGIGSLIMSSQPILIGLIAWAVARSVSRWPPCWDWRLPCADQCCWSGAMTWAFGRAEI